MHALINKNTGVVEKFVNDYNTKNKTISADGFYGTDGYMIVSNVSKMLKPIPNRYIYEKGRFKLNKNQVKTTEERINESRAKAELRAKLKPTEDDMLELLEDLVTFCVSIGYKIPEDKKEILLFRKMQRLTQ